MCMLSLVSMLYLVGHLQALIHLPDGLVRGSLLNHLACQLQVVIAEDHDSLLHDLRTEKPESSEG